MHALMDVVHHMGKAKERDHMIISIDAEGAFDRVQHLFMMRVLQIIRVDGIYLGVMGALCGRPTSCWMEEK